VSGSEYKSEDASWSRSEDAAVIEGRESADEDENESFSGGEGDRERFSVIVSGGYSTPAT
jgi:hypothetical protein